VSFAIVNEMLLSPHSRLIYCYDGRSSTNADAI